jgi:hypothetical protein
MAGITIHLQICFAIFQRNTASKQLFVISLRCDWRFDVDWTLLHRQVALHSLLKNFGFHGLSKT